MARSRVVSLITATLLALTLVPLTLPAANAAGGSWISRSIPGGAGFSALASSSDGSALVGTVTGGYIHTSSDSGVTWTTRTGSGQRAWIAVASSADGSRLLAADRGGLLYRSTDSGVTWAEVAAPGSAAWTGVASSADGNRLVAVAAGTGSLWRSENAGSSWASIPGAGIRNWSAVGMSADGSQIVAVESALSAVDSSAVMTYSDGGTWTNQVENDPILGVGMSWSAAAATNSGAMSVAATGDYIYTSSDAGVSWTPRSNAGAAPWTSIAMTSSRLLAVGSDGTVVTSTNSGSSWTARTVSATPPWRAAASSSDGMALAIAGDGTDVFTTSDGGDTWVDQTDSGTHNWTAVATSTDGQTLIALDGGFDPLVGGAVYLSTDGGVSWTEQLSAGRRTWWRVAMSSDGSTAAAVARGGFTSVVTYDAANTPTWSELTNPGHFDWSGVAVSGNGVRMMGAVNGGQIYTSVDAGLNWTARDSARPWSAIVSSTTGVNLAASTAGGSIYTSTNSGAAWTARASGTDTWSALATSSDGTKLAAVASSGTLKTSTDSGVTWTPRTVGGGAQPFTSVASSADGSVLMAASLGGGMFRSTNAGVTWVAEPGVSGRNFTTVASASDGFTAVAAESGGRIWTRGLTPITVTATSPTFDYLGTPVQPGFEVSGFLGADTWVTPPTCAAFSSLDTGFAFPVTINVDTLPGTYVTRCTGGNPGTGYATPTHVTGLLTITKLKQDALEITSATQMNFRSSLLLTTQGQGTMSSDPTITFAIIGGTAAGCAITPPPAAPVLTSTGVGTCIVEATQNGDLYYDPVTSPPVEINVKALNPTPPVTPVASPRLGSIQVKWWPTVDTGGSTLDWYVATATPVSGTGAKSCTMPSYAFICTINGLTNGRAYRVSVVSKTRAKLTSTPAAVVSPIIVGTPQAPRKLTIGFPAAKIAQASWLAPLTDPASVVPPVVAYEAHWYDAATKKWTPWTRTSKAPAPPLTTAVALGRVKLRNYLVEVRAVNRWGPGQVLYRAFKQLK